MTYRSAAFSERYDAAIFDPAARTLYDGTDFFNVGDWSPGPDGPPASLGQAAKALVERHLRADADDEARRSNVVLDVGCGLGSGAALMGAHYPNALVLGINLSAVQAIHAARTAPGARFAAMDAARLAVGPDRVDRVHCVEAAFHFDSRDDFLNELRRVLRPGGKAILTDILFRRGLGEDVPARNIWIGENQYRARCAQAGLEIELLQDITEWTLLPFYAFLEAQGQGRRGGAASTGATGLLLHRPAQGRKFSLNQRETYRQG